MNLQPISGGRKCSAGACPQLRTLGQPAGSGVPTASPFTHLVMPAINGAPRTPIRGRNLWEARVVSSEIRTLPPAGAPGFHNLVCRRQSARTTGTESGYSLLSRRRIQQLGKSPALTHMVKHTRSFHKRRRRPAMRSGGFAAYTAPDQLANS